MPNAGITTFNGSIRTVEGGVILGDTNAGARVSELRFNRVAITSAQILALNATPITLVAAPGTGKYLEFMGLTMILKSTATAYAAVATKNLAVKYTNGAGVTVSTQVASTGFMDQVVDVITTLKDISTDVVIAANAALVMQMLTGEITTGTGTLVIDVMYRIHETAA